jgi:SAM-dependent methyltransferase
MSWEATDPANRAMDEQRDEALTRLATGLGRSLDVGCGRGHLLGVLALRGVGVDLSIVRLRLAAAPVAQADAARLPFPDAAFDALLLVNVLSSIPTGRAQVAAEVRRVLAPDGTVLWYDQRWSNPGNRSTRPVSRRELDELFPGATVDVTPITVAAPLARTFPRSYDRLHRLSFLRSHLVGTIRP